MSTRSRFPHRHPHHGSRAARAALLWVILTAVPAAGRTDDAGADFPARLSGTGLYAPGPGLRVAADCLEYLPQYPLWTDGATKRRWIRLPAGTAVDASNPDRWVFPVGTRLFKEFSFGRPVETRMIERGPEGWRFAAYVWNEDGTDAVLAPAGGVRSVVEIAPGVGYDVPGRTDCLACHQGGRDNVLGFDALQLSGDVDPLAPHGGRPPGSPDLADLVARGVVTNWPAGVSHAPRIESADGARERAVLGYLHGNCAACHNAEGPLAMVGLDFEFRLAAAATSPEWATGGHPKRPELVRRISTRNPYVQMPPLGTHLVDEDAIGLVDAWIREGIHPEPIANAPEPPPGGKE